VPENLDAEFILDADLKQDFAEPGYFFAMRKRKIRVICVIRVGKKIVAKQQ